MQSIIPKVAAFSQSIRVIVSQTMANILRLEDNALLGFKLEILKELHKVVKDKQHHHMEPWVLDCLVLHDIMVDEAKARIVDETAKKNI